MGNQFNQSIKLMQRLALKIKINTIWRIQFLLVLLKSHGEG
ncbi:MAG TPA: hypothetical protein VLR49_06270 [Ferruginibacter sp.]|nr:hypothetical protein [Ferruginibacter sp.]